MRKSTVFLTGALVTAIGVCVTFYIILAEKQRFTDALYEKSLGVLVSSAHSVENSLSQKGDADKISSEVSLACGRATEAISSLPLADYDTLLLEAYFNRTAEYVAYLADREISSEPQTVELLKYASRITEELDGIQHLFRSKKSEFRDVLTPTEKSSGFRLIRKELDDIGQQLSDAINTIEEVPSLRYDGRYSQEEKTARTETDIGWEKAGQTAGEGWKPTGKSEGENPCYMFTKGESTVWISASEGKTVRLINGECICDGEADTEDIRQNAENFLTQNGYVLPSDAQTDIKGSKYFIKGGDLTLSFCANCGRLLAFDVN